jgi:RHS repeat-associated protein
MQMVGRKYSATTATTYRFGFNGKEDDKDINVGVQDYGMRIYSERLGRFLSVDPLSNKYPWYTPYQFAGNTPIQAIDLDGGEPKWMIDETGHLTKPMVTLLNSAFGFGKNMFKIPWNAVHKESYGYFGQSLGTTNGLVYQRQFRWNARWMNLFEKDNPQEWVSMWVNLVVHEGKHMDDMSKYGIPLFYITYGITTAIAELEYPDPKKGFYNENSFWEARAYSIETSPTLGLFNLEGGLAIKVLKSDLDDNLKNSVLEYVGKAFKLDQIKQQKESATGGQLKRLNKKIAKLEKVVEKLNTKEVQAVRKKMSEQANETIITPKPKEEYQKEEERQKDAEIEKLHG